MPSNEETSFQPPCISVIVHFSHNNLQILARRGLKSFGIQFVNFLCYQDKKFFKEEILNFSVFDYRKSLFQKIIGAPWKEGIIQLEVANKCFGVS